MENKELLELEALVTKLDAIDDDNEAEIEKVVMGTVNAEELQEEDLDNVVGGVTEAGVLVWLVKNTKLGKLSWTGLKVSARCFYDYAKYGNAYRTYSKSYVNKLGADFDKAVPGWMKKVGEWSAF